MCGKVLLDTTQYYIFKISRKTKIAHRCKRGIIIYDISDIEIK